MFALHAPSAFPARAVSHVHGKATDSAAGVLFGSLLTQETSFLDEPPPTLPGQTATSPENAGIDNNDSTGAQVPAVDAKNNTPVTIGAITADVPDAELAQAVLPKPVELAPKTPAAKTLVMGMFSLRAKPADSSDKKTNNLPKADVAAPAQIPVQAALVRNPITSMMDFELALKMHKHLDTSGNQAGDKKVGLRSTSMGGRLNQDTPRVFQGAESSKLEVETTDNGDTEDSLQAESGLPKAPTPVSPDVADTQPGQPGPAAELTFASRIQEAGSDALTASPQQNTAQPARESAPVVGRADAPDPTEPTVVKPAPHGDDHKVEAAKTESASNAQAIAYSNGSRTDFKAQIAETRSTSASSRVETPAHPEPAKSTTPLKDVTFQLKQSNESVEVRIVQQAGEVRVAVRTGDTDLAHGLRQDLSDLSGKLQQGGYHAETWRPSAITESAGTANGGRNGSSDQGQGQSQSQSGGSQGDGSQQDRRRFGRPKWVEEMESTMNTAVESKGVTNGFGN